MHTETLVAAPSLSISPPNTLAGRTKEQVELRKAEHTL